MKITIGTRPVSDEDATAEAEEIRAHGFYILMDALAEFVSARESLEGYMDRRYPIDGGGVFTKPFDREKKRAQVLARCRAARTMRRAVDHIKVEEDEMSVVVPMPLKSKRPGVRLMIALTDRWVAFNENGSDRVESIHKFIVLRFLREQEVDLDDPLTRRLVYRVAMDLPPVAGGALVPPADFNLEAYK